MKTKLLTLLIAFIALILTSCHETIHMHPWNELEANETVLLSLTIDNRAPQLGAIVDYTVEPPVIVYSDNLPEEILSRTLSTNEDADANGQEIITSRATALADYFNQLAPYSLDGDEWEIHLKYEIYACSIDKIKSGNELPFYKNKVIYRADEVSPVHDVDIDLPFGVITVVSVAHIVPAGTEDDWFFNTSTLHTLICDMSRRNGLQDHNIYRDCFAVAQEFMVSPTGIEDNVQHIAATLTRPQGRYIVLADDYSQYLSFGGKEINNILSDIHYPTYLNTAYSLLAGRPVSSDFDFGFNSTPSKAYADGDEYVFIAEDWSIVNEPQSNINMNIRVVDRENLLNIISDNPGIQVPLFSDRVTLVVGHWMTETHEGGGGVGVDPTFTDEIVIHF